MDEAAQDAFQRFLRPCDSEEDPPCEIKGLVALVVGPPPGLGARTNYYNILGLYRDNGKENGNYYNIYIYIGLYRNNGKENGKYNNILGLYTADLD